MCIIVNVPEIIQLSSRNTFVSDILYNTFVTIPLYTIPYTGIPCTNQGSMSRLIVAGLPGGLKHKRLSTYMYTNGENETD